MALVAEYFRLGETFGAEEDARGGQGTVYRGYDTRKEATHGEYADEALVAIKLFDRRDMAATEYAMGQRVQPHENLIDFLAFDPNFGEGAIVMRPAVPFFNVAIDMLPLPMAAARKIVAQAARGLAHMHSRNVAHLDMKMENLLIVHDTVKLCDFGQSQDAGIAAPQARVGTKGWRAPEVPGGPGWVAPPGAGANFDVCKADVWSLGIFAYVLTQGHMPFNYNAENLAGLPEYQPFVTAQRQGGTGVAALASYWTAITGNDRWSTLDDRYREALERTMHYDPQSRWSLDEVLSAMESASTAPAPQPAHYLDDDDDVDAPIYRHTRPASNSVSGAASFGAGHYGLFDGCSATGPTPLGGEGGGESAPRVMRLMEG